MPRIDDASSDFLKVLLKLKDNIMKDLHVSTLAQVKSINNRTCVCKPFPLVQDEVEKTIEAQLIDNLSVQVNDIVVILFVDRNFLSSIKMLEYSQVLSSIKKSSELHSEKYGIIINKITFGSSASLPSIVDEQISTQGSSIVFRITDSGGNTTTQTIEVPAGEVEPPYQLDFSSTSHYTEGISSEGKGTYISFKLLRRPSVDEVLPIDDAEPLEFYDELCIYAATLSVQKDVNQTGKKRRRRRLRAYVRHPLTETEVSDGICSLFIEAEGGGDYIFSLMHTLKMKSWIHSKGYTDHTLYARIMRRYRGDDNDSNSKVVSNTVILHPDFVVSPDDETRYVKVLMI